MAWVEVWRLENAECHQGLPRDRDSWSRKEVGRAWRTVGVFAVNQQLCCPRAEHGEPDVLKDELQLYEGAPGEMVPSEESGEVEPSQLRRLNIKKDDWFISLGVGLLTFASLETVGIYFGLVYRIHSVLHGFVPLLQKFRLIGFRKTD
eukprot:bmy_00407T0